MKEHIEPFIGGSGEHGSAEKPIRLIYGSTDRPIDSWLTRWATQGDLKVS
jgi:hypothetical protein